MKGYYDMPNKEEAWVIDKRISVGNILTLTSVIVISVAWAIRLENRIDFNTSLITHNADEIAKVEERVHEQYEEIIRRLERLDTKIDNVRGGYRGGHNVTGG